MTQIVDAFRKEWTLLQFQHYASFIEKSQIYLFLGYNFLWSLEKDNDILKIIQSKLLSIAGWNDVYYVMKRLLGTFQAEQHLREAV